MRVSLCNEVIAELPFARQCELAASLGYDGLELAPCTLSDDPTTLTAGEITALRRAAHDAGIAITGLHYLLRAPAGLSITSADATVRQRTIEVMRRMCDLCAELGGTILVHGSPDQRVLAPGDEADGARRGAVCFAAVADAAAEAKVTYCIEPLARNQTAFINTVADAAEIVRQVGNPALRTMVDCSAAGQTEAAPVDALIRQWVPTGLIGHVHFNDPNRRGPGEGALAFGPILTALRESAYQGDASIEPFIYRPDGPTCAARGIGYIRGLMQMVMS